MRRMIVGVLMALLLAFPILAAAGEVTGKVTAIDRQEGALVIDNGIKIWVSNEIAHSMVEGATVKASYTDHGGRNVATEVEHRVMGPGGQETTSFAGTLGAAGVELESPGD